MKTKTTTKPATKPAQKPAPTKTVARLAYAILLAECLAGKYGDVIKRFYLNAISYHAKQKTTFPRGRIATVALMNETDARAFIEARMQTSIPPGSLPGQRLFDEMMVQNAIAQSANKGNA